MALKSFQIVLDNPKAAFISNEKEQTLVTGRVVIESNKNEEIEGLQVFYKGNAKVKWSKLKTNFYESYASNENYFFTKLCLAGSGDGNLTGKKILLASGVEHSYPFRLMLPPHLPSSCVEKHGRIAYKIKAVAKRSWSFDFKVKKRITIFAPLEPNMFPNYMLPLQIKSEEHYGFLLSRFALTLLLRLKTRIIVPGLDYPVTVDVKNKSNVDVQQVIGTIKKYTTFRLKSPDTKCKVERKVMCMFKLDAPDRKRSKTTTVMLPPLNETACNVDACHNIDIDYMMIIKAVTVGLHKNVKIKHPVKLMTPVGS